MTTKKFQKTILDWYKQNGRHDLPWRKTANPYRICVSELMLQQTQVDRVIPKYTEFLKIFPTVTALATAPTAEVLAAWQGLGYNRRALYLKKTAQIIAEHSGRWSHSPEELEKLPGIGPYTARAIATFCWNSREIFLETNIRRVFIHFFFSDFTEPVHDRQILPLIASTLPPGNPREWYWALMDYGTLALKTISNPNRRSRSYTKQSPFKGSHRQIRGQILRLLLDKKTVTMKHLEAALSLSPNRLIPALDELAREGFLLKTVVRKGDIYRLIS